MFQIDYWRGALIGTFLGLCLGMYLTSQMFSDKIPNNPSYTGKIEERLK